MVALITVISLDLISRKQKKNVSDFKQWIKDNVKSDINITPIYDKSTKDLWTIHGEKYLEGFFFSVHQPS